MGARMQDRRRTMRIFHQNTGSRDVTHRTFRSFWMSKITSSPICVTIFSNLEVIGHSSNMWNTFVLVMDNLIKVCAFYIAFKCSFLCYNLVDRNWSESQCFHHQITFNADSSGISLFICTFFTVRLSNLYDNIYTNVVTKTLFHPLLLLVFLTCFNCYALLNICCHSHSPPLPRQYVPYSIRTSPKPFRGAWRLLVNAHIWLQINVSYWLHVYFSGIFKLADTFIRC